MSTMSPESRLIPTAGRWQLYVAAYTFLLGVPLLLFPSTVDRRDAPGDFPGPSGFWGTPSQRYRRFKAWLPVYRTRSHAERHARSAHKEVMQCRTVEFSEGFVAMTRAFNEQIVEPRKGRTAENTTPTRFEDFVGELARALR